MRASDQGFLPISLEQYVMLLDWTGTASGQAWGDSRASGPDNGAAGAEWIKLGRDLPASVECSSRRRADRARSSMPPRAVRGAGSRARRRLRATFVSEAPTAEATTVVNPLVNSAGPLKARSPRVRFFP